MVTWAAVAEHIHPAARTRRFWIRLLSGAAVIGVGLALLLSRYRIGFSPEAEESVGSAWTWVHLHAGPVPVGDYAVFRTDRRVKLFPPGTEFVKLIVGGPGDLVRVGVNQTTVNGVKVAGPLDSAPALGVPAQTFVRTFILGPGDYFAVGTRPYSYDSRYWGPVHQRQFIGTARLW